MPERLKKGKMIGARFVPHRVAQLRSLARDGESLTAALERIVGELLDVDSPPGALYFTVNEARLVMFPGDMDGLEGACVMRALPVEDGVGFFVVELKRGDGKTWEMLPGEWRAEQLPIHEDEY